MKDILISFLSKTLKMDNESVAEMLFKKSDDGKISEAQNPDALAKILEAHSAHVGKLTENGKMQFDNGYKKAQSEIANRLETAAKKAFGYTGEEVGEDLFLSLANLKIAPNDESVKGSKAYKELQASIKAEAEKVKNEYEQKIADIQNGLKKAETWNLLEGKISETFRALNPVLSSDAAKAKRQEAEFVKRFKNQSFENLNGNFVLIEDGKAKLDGHGHPITLTDLVKGEAESLYDFSVQETRGNAGNGHQSAGANNYTHTHTANQFRNKTKDELMELYFSEQQPAETLKLISEALQEKQ